MLVISVVISELQCMFFHNLLHVGENILVRVCQYRMMIEKRKEKKMLLKMLL